MALAASLVLLQALNLLGQGCSLLAKVHPGGLEAILVPGHSPSQGQTCDSSGQLAFSSLLPPQEASSTAASPLPGACG